METTFVDGTEVCLKGHPVAKNAYTEGANGPTRCRACKTAQKRRERHGVKTELVYEERSLVDTYRPRASDIERANFQWQTGEAQNILARYGTTATDAAEAIGVNVGTIGRWLRGGVPQARYQRAAAAYLMSEESVNEDNDAILETHGYPRTRDGLRRHTADLDAGNGCAGYPACRACRKARPWLANLAEAR